MGNAVMEKKAQEIILEAHNLHTYFFTRKGVVKAVNDVSIRLKKRKTLALVGESGCGKTVTALSIMRLIPQPGQIISGSILYEGENILRLPERRMRTLRGNRISMIFQEPMTSLNPVFRIGDQIAEVFLTHERIAKKEASERSVELLKMVGIPSPGKCLNSYPHQLSGGMQQRAMIAMALASPQPGILIADEPTTALDVTIQAQILELMKELQRKIDMSLLLITHDMGVVAEMADYVAVMYASKKVEEGIVYDVFESPMHPYTVGLLNSIPSNRKYKNAKRLEAIPGVVPNLLEIGGGCPFANRCRFACTICRQSFPEAKIFKEDHLVHCYRAGEISF